MNRNVASWSLAVIFCLGVVSADEQRIPDELLRALQAKRGPNMPHKVNGLVNGSFEFRKGSLQSNTQLKKLPIINFAKNKTVEVLVRIGPQAPSGIETLKPGSDALLGWEIIDASSLKPPSDRDLEDIKSDVGPRLTVDWIGPQRWTASHGKHCLDLDGGIRQTVPTVEGQSYELRFDMAGNAETLKIVQTLNAYIDQRHHAFQFDTRGKLPRKMGWKTMRLVFTANASKTVITFLNTKPNSQSAGVALDNVVLRKLDSDVKPQPQPQPQLQIDRQTYLEQQIKGLLKEAAGLRKAGRDVEAKQHEEKAKYRRKQLEDSLKATTKSNK